VKRLRIFIASPGDVSEERDIVSNVVIPEIQRIFGDNQLLGNKHQIELEAIRWETHAWPDVGDDAQDVINQEIGAYDILVGIMWKRFGTPTKRAGSGTGEEFERAYEYFKAYKKPKIMFYFRTAPFYTTTSSELAQFQKVVKFRGKLEELGVLFWEYNSPLQFERNVREHLIRQIRQWIKPSKELSKSPTNKGANTKGRKSKKSTKSTTRTLPLPGGMKIFLSYARQDLELIKPIYYLLKDAGYQAWLDVETLLPGQDWLLEIEKAIKESNVFLVFLSSQSVNKKGYVQKEIKLAFDKVQTLRPEEVFLIPVRLEPVMPPEWLNRYQWIDYFAEGGPERLMLAIKMAVEQQRKRGGR
jgi:hypothetical protein